MNAAYDPHLSMNASYQIGILNRADRLEALMSERGLLDGVSTLLSVGIGAGHLECKLAQERNIALSYLEPSAPMAAAVAANIARCGIADRVAAHRCTFEVFAAPERYDLILALDSWYRIGCDRDSLQKALDLRAPGGKLLIQLMTRQEQLYWALDRVRGLIAADELSAWASQQGFVHQYFTHAHSVPTSRLLDGDRPSEDYRHFVAFAKGRAWTELDAGERDEAVRLVHQLADAGVLTSQYGFLLFE